MLKTVSSFLNVVGALNYKGTWDAATNDPTLTSSVGTKGDYYVVSVSGSTNLNGITDWVVSDWCVFNGSVWQKVDNSEVIYVSNVATGTGLTGGPITSTGTVSLANTAVTIGTYGGATNVASFTVDQQGRLTSASNVTIAISNSAVSGLGTMSTQNANAVAITGGTVDGITGNVVGAIPNGSVTNVLLQNSTATLGNTTITLGATTSTVGNLTLSNVTVSSGNVTANVTLTNATNASATFATSSLPLVPAGYIKFQLANSTVVLIPYYAE